MSDSMGQALKEGISLEPDTNGASNTPQTTETAAKPEASAPSTPQETATPQATSPANTPAKPEENLPFHKHPDFTKAIKEARESRRMAQELQRQLAEQKAFIDGLRNGNSQPKAGIPDEQRQAAIQLAKLLKEVPEFAQELGLDRIPKLESSTQEFAMARAEEAHAKELSEVISYAKSLGLDENEVSERLMEMSTNDPFYANQNYTQGLVQKMFRDAYWDKMGELKERELNQKLIKEQEAKRKANSEVTANSASTQKALPNEKSAERYLERRIREEGGLVI